MLRSELKSDTVARSELRLFSDRPLLHYFLAIGITSIAVFFFLAFRIYECLNGGNAYDCRYDPDSPAMIGAHGASTPSDRSVLLATTLISAFSGLFSFLLFLILCAPVYALAHYAGLRFAVHRNVVGIAFWIGAWTLAFLSLPILNGVDALFDPGHRSWAADLFQSFLFVMYGLFCGIVYCALAFLHRDKALES